MTDYTPSTTKITLTIRDDTDDDSITLHRLTFNLPLYGPHWTHIDAAQNMTASRLLVGEDGWRVQLDQVEAVVGTKPNHWADWWQAFSMHPCEGMAAFAAMRAFALWASTRHRARGERGKNLDGLDRRETLLAAALVGMVEGRSQRAAVEFALNEYEPNSTARDAAALRRALNRYLAGDDP